MFFGGKAVSRTSCLEHKNGRFTYEPSVLCSMFAKKTTAAKSNCSADDFLLLPFLSRKKRKGGRFLFLKKRNKRHCGGGCFSEERRFPARPAWSIKTDGLHMNRPFCVACSRKRQQQRRATVPQMIFFCVVGLHGKAGAQARRTRAETRRRREAYPLRYSDRRQRRMCLRPSV